MLDTFEVQRGERIDALADRWLRRGDTRPATEVWDAARDVVDALYAREARQRAEDDRCYSCGARDPRSHTIGCYA
jgi:hypothetical protein